MTITGSSILQRDPGVTAVLAPYGPRGPVIAGTSSTPANIALGPVVFTMNEYGLGFTPGVRLRATVIGATDQWVEGVVTDYTDNQLALSVDLFSGNGIYSNWQVSVAGQPGVQGPIGPVGATGQVPEAPQNGLQHLRVNAVWQPLDADLAAIAALTGTNTIYYRSGSNVWSPVVIGSGIGFSGGTISAASGGGNVSNSGTPVAGQLARWINNQQIVGFDASTVYAPYPLMVPEHGRLQFVSSTQLSFLPFKGNAIKINGLIYQIPSTGNGIAGLTPTNAFVNGIANQSVVANTFYYVYAFLNGAVVTADFSTTGHATSTTAGNEGVEIKSGDNTRTLLGMIYTTGASSFFYVSSWFNRRNLSVIGAPANVTHASAAYVELSGASRAYFMNWQGEAVQGTVVGSGNSSVGGVQSGIGLWGGAGSPGTAAALTGGTIGMHAAAGWITMTDSTTFFPSPEGLCFVTPASVSWNSVNITFGCVAMVLYRG